jgi:pyruvate kinase
MKHLKDKRKSLAKQKLAADDERMVNHIEAEDRVAVDRAAIEVQIQEFDNKMRKEKRDEEDWEWYR